MTKTHPVQNYEQNIITNAAYWTAICFRGRPHSYERHEFATRCEAQAFARIRPRPRAWMIYAVTAGGRSVHVENIVGLATLHALA